MLQACELGDIQRVTGVLKEHANLNVDCVDLMGRTPLQITVEREDKDVSTNNGLKVRFISSLCRQDNPVECTRNTGDAAQTLSIRFAVLSEIGHEFYTHHGMFNWKLDSITLGITRNIVWRSIIRPSIDTRPYSFRVVPNKTICVYASHYSADYCC